MGNERKQGEERAARGEARMGKSKRTEKRKPKRAFLGNWESEGRRGELAASNREIASQWIKKKRKGRKRRASLTQGRRGRIWWAK